MTIIITFEARRAHLNRSVPRLIAS